MNYAKIKPVDVAKRRSNSESFHYISYLFTKINDIIIVGE